MIRIRQCQDDCCLVREPSKRFWLVTTPAGKLTAHSFTTAVFIADAHIQTGVPS